MTVRPFMADLPKEAGFGDEVVLKGKLRDDAREFSINFTLESCPIPSNIAYHFKTRFDDNTVIHNTKWDGEWNEEIVDTNNWIRGPGQEFVVTFLFDQEEIIVYSDDENRCFQYRFSSEHIDIDKIRSVQVWDDVEYINEIVFRYKK